MKAIQYRKSVPRFLLVKLFSRWWPGIATGPLGCVGLRDLPEPELPKATWVKITPVLSGICGSDLATVYAKGSPYFSPLTSCPFVLGHETVGRVKEVGSDVDTVAVGDRVVIEPALGCRVRGIDPLCPPCRAGTHANCENVTQGDISAGIQTGYCRDTGGVWSGCFVAHHSQLHRVPDSMPDRVAVLVEPAACAVHAALKMETEYPETIVLIGCGAMGLLTLAALRFLGCRSRILASAWLPAQAEYAKSLGADAVTLARGKELYRTVREFTGASEYRAEIGKPYLFGGPPVIFDCVGSGESIDDALRLTSARGRVVLVGMPGIPRGVDWTPIWHKELRVMGSYAYGTETYNGRSVGTFHLAIEFLSETGEKVGPLVGAEFPLSEYRRALVAALFPQQTGAVKTVFDLGQG